MKKLILINPTGLKNVGHVGSDILWPPLGLCYIAAATPRDWEVKLVDENFDVFAFEEADLVGITAMTATVTRAYKIAAEYRARGIKVVLGGIHASVMPDEALQFCDSIVVGEGESIWGSVVRDFEAGALRKKYMADKVDFAREPIVPRRDILHPGYVWDSIQTGRGCPFNCKFCTVSRTQGRQYRKRDIESVVAEFSGLTHDYVMFTDDNLFGYSDKDRAYAKELLGKIADRCPGKHLFIQTSMNAAEHDDLLETAARAGCIVAFIGFESIDKKALKGMNKGINLKTGPDKYDDIARAFHKHGIAVSGAFIIGTDEENKGYCSRLASFLSTTEIDIARIAIMTPFPGTELWEEMVRDDRLTVTEYPAGWDQFRMSTFAVFEPEGKTPEDIYMGLHKAKAALYLSPGYEGRIRAIKGRLAHAPVAMDAACRWNEIYKLYWDSGKG